MFSKEAILRRVCNGQTCECSILPNKPQSENKENFFLAPASPGHLTGRHPQVFRKQQEKIKARKSLRQKKTDRQNKSSLIPSQQSSQPKSMTSNSFVLDINSQNPKQSLIYKITSERSPLVELQNYLETSSNYSKFMTTNQGNVRGKNDQDVENSTYFKKNTIKIRFSQHCSQKRNEKKVESDIKPRLDRAQSTDNIIIPKLKLNEITKKKGSEWRSQFVNVELEKSTQKLTHRLTELNMKCTESINDSESLKISEVVSQSESNRSDTNRTETLPKRIKDLMHMKYSKMEGNKY